VIDDAAPPPVPSQAPSPSSDTGAIPAPRVVSDDELLGAETHGPESFLRLRAVSDSARLRKAARAALAAAVAAAVAFVCGVTTHGADLHKAADTARQRMLLRLVGGSTTLGLPDLVHEDPTATTASPNEPVTTQLQIAVRNDGAQPATVVSVDLSQPGVKVTKSAATTVVHPGETAAFEMSVQVDCGAADLKDQPESVTLHVQDADARASTVALPVAAGETATTAGPPNLLSPSQLSGAFLMCGFAEVNDPPTTSYTGPITSATTANPVFGFKVAVHNYGSRPKSLAPSKLYANLPGVSLTTDLTASVPLPAGASVDANVTLRIADCAKLGRLLKVEDGIYSYLSVAGQQLPVGVQSADPRFRTETAPLSVDDGVSAFDHDLLVNLAAACPALK
jgi:hypothetical protein